MSGAPFVYAIATVILSLNLMLLWIGSGAVRGRTKTVTNPEDTRVVRGATVAEGEPPEVARVLRAHHNSLVNTVPFLFVGQLYVAAGVSETMAWIVLGGFAAARVLYSLCYVGGIQPWRSISFAVGVTLTFVMIIHLLVLLFT